MKIFTTHSPSEIPPVAKTGFESQYSLSNRFFASAKTTGGEAVITTARYDHSRQKWLTGGAGEKEVIEYYKEVPVEHFMAWLGNNPHVGHLDGETLLAMFNSMDDEDKLTQAV